MSHARIVIAVCRAVVYLCAHNLSIYCKKQRTELKCGTHGKRAVQLDAVVCAHADAILHILP